MKKVWLFLAFTLITFIFANPYSILGVAPYYSMKDIKDKYLELMSQNHPEKFSVNKDDVKTNFEKIQKAYEDIKLTRTDEDDEDDSNASGIFFAIKKCLWSIFFGVSIVLIAYLVVFLSFEILNFTYRFMVVLIFVFFPTEYFLAHKFENEETQYFFSFLMSLSVVMVLYFRNKFNLKKNVSDIKPSNENSPLIKK
jgi:hypothetical protein